MDLGARGPITPNVSIYNIDDCKLAPGESVAHSGLYEICHTDEPRAVVVLRRHEIFPACLRCGDQVRYKLLHAAPHISEDPDFAESSQPFISPPEVSGTRCKNLAYQLGAAHGFRYWQA